MPNTKANPLAEDDDDASFTEPLDDELNLSETDFIEEFLRPCCLNAAKKLNEAGKQYSKTAWAFVRKHSILRDVEEDMNGNVVYSDFKADDGHIIRGYETVFLTDTLQRYAAERFFPLKDYDFTAIAPGKVLSQDMYCRFLTYRIINPNLKKGDHATRLYSMKCGELPTEIADNILHYHEIINLPKQRHRIDRYDILIVYFYYFLMAHWKDGKNSFRAKNQAEATALWQTFFNAANPVLEDNGYAEFSAKNPLDLLLRISLLSVAPLEIYLRIYELNAITSLANDPDFQPTEYPGSDRVWKTLDDLTKTYENLNLRNLQAEIDELANLRQRVKKILPRRRI